jgi:predicted TIM-barrel fold metal-dependent hydrolase
MRITDCHVHIGQNLFFHMDADADFLVREADRAGIERMLITDIISLFYDIDEGNAYLREQIARHPDRLAGYYSVGQARYAPEHLDKFERHICEYGFIGLKIYSVPPLQLIADSYLYPMIEKAAELRVPILAHSTGEECEAISRRVPEAILLNAHMGCCPQANGDWHRSIAAAKAYPNIYLDTTSSSFDNNMIEHAVAEVGAERILYGSDLPLLDPVLQVAKVTEADISDEAKQQILHGNIERLLKLKEAA